jgi:hypothetical protein
MADSETETEVAPLQTRGVCTIARTGRLRRGEVDAIVSSPFAIKKRESGACELALTESGSASAIETATAMLAVTQNAITASGEWSRALRDPTTAEALSPEIAALARAVWILASAICKFRGRRQVGEATPSRLRQEQLTQSLSISMGFVATYGIPSIYWSLLVPQMGRPRGRRIGQPVADLDRRIVACFKAYRQHIRARLGRLVESLKRAGVVVSHDIEIMLSTRDATLVT